MRNWLSLILATTGLTGFFSIYVLCNFPMGSAGEWSELYATDPAWVMILWLLPSSFALIGFAIWCSESDEINSKRKRLQWWAPIIFAALCFWNLKSAVHLRQAGDASNYFYFTSPMGPGAFSGQALNIQNPSQYLRNFPELANQHWGKFGGTRVVSNPPGTSLLLYGCRRVLESSPLLLEYYGHSDLPSVDTSVQEKRTYLATTLAQFAPDVFMLLMALGMIPLWCLGCQLLPAAHAPIAAALISLTPSLFVFSYSKDAFQMAFALWFWWAFHRAFARNSLISGFLSGIFLAVGLFFSLSFIIVAGLAFVVGAIKIWTTQPTQENEISSRVWSHNLKLLGLCLAGLVVPVALFSYVTGYDPIRSSIAAFKGHAQFEKDFTRSYGIWIWLNLFHFFMFLGGPAVAIYAAAFYKHTQNVGLIPGNAGSQPAPEHQHKEKQAGCLRSQGKLPHLFDPYFLGVTSLLFVLNFSGMNLGEVPRLWLFLMPAVLVSAMRVLLTEDLKLGKTAWILLTFQLLQAVVFLVKLDPVGASQRALGDSLFQGLQ